MFAMSARCDDTDENDQAEIVAAIEELILADAEEYRLENHREWVLRDGRRR